VAHVQRAGHGGRRGVDREDGIGSTLVDVVTDRGRDHGAGLLHADVSLDNGRMRVLLARRGWVGKVVGGDYCMDLVLSD
jgi:hypothetical protein